jgi:mono/diheme cytochrome c family protein
MIDSLYSFLSRVGFTDPLHPPIVHIPIGLVIGAFVFFAVALLFNRKQLVLTARHVSILALVFVFPSMLFGVLDWIHFYHAAPIPVIRIKMVLAVILLVLLTLGIVLGGKGKSRNAAMLVVYACSVLAVVALGYFGASLVYGGRGAAAKAQSDMPISSAAPAGPDSTQAALVPGRVIFEDDCQACHPGGGNSVYPKLPMKGSRRLASLESLESFIRAPTMPDSKVGDMPAFGTDTLSAAQVKELYSYLSAQFK